VRLEIHPLAFLVGSRCLLGATWLALRPDSAPADHAGKAFAARAAQARERKTIELPADVLSATSARICSTKPSRSRCSSTVVVCSRFPRAHTRYELKPTSEKEFYLADLDADVAFEVDANERVVGFSAKLPWARSPRSGRAS
jgi:hypothetical protein